MTQQQYDPYARYLTNQPNIDSGVSRSGAGLDPIYQTKQGTVDWQMMSEILHIDAQTAYQQYVAQFVRARPRDPEASGSVLGQVPSVSQWFNSALTADSVSNIMSVVEINWDQEGLGPMPPELRKKIEAAINGMEPAGRWSLLGMLQDASSGRTSFTAAANDLFKSPVINNTIADWEAAHPNIQKKAADLAAQSKQNFISSFYSNFGKMPTQQQIDTIGSMDAQSQESWMSQQPYKFGIKLGDWNKLRSTVSSRYYDAFGSMPDDNTLANYAGMTPTQIEDHINQSPSNKVQGMTVGEYTGIHKELSSAMNEEFGYDAPSELVKLFAGSK